MADGDLLTRRKLMVVAAGGGACAVAFAAPSTFQGLADLAATFDENFTSPYRSLVSGDHESWGAQQGQTFATAEGHSLQVLGVHVFKPYGRRVQGVSRSRAFAVDFQLVGGNGMAVEKIHSVTDSDQVAMDLYLTGVGSKPGVIRAMFN